MENFSSLVIEKTTNSVCGWIFFIGLAAGDNLIFCFSDSLAHKTFSTIKRFAFSLRAIPNCSTKSRKSISSFLICASNCFF